MPKDTDHRSFTVRIPFELYCEIAEEARKDDVSINYKVGQYIRSGMGETLDLNERIMQLIEKRLLPELNQELANVG